MTPMEVVGKVFRDIEDAGWLTEPVGAPPQPRFALNVADGGAAARLRFHEVTAPPDEERDEGLWASASVIAEPQVPALGGESFREWTAVRVLMHVPRRFAANAYRLLAALDGEFLRRLRMTGRLVGLGFVSDFAADQRRSLERERTVFVR